MQHKKANRTPGELTEDTNTEDSDRATEIDY